ncbi:MAG: A/G-specific adenine glycosylase [Acidiferrobacter thiooxydans]
MDEFALKVLAWYRRHGRHDLPWQVPDPYVRWLAEVMLQQTTVTAVIPYFQRFLAAFPSVRALAQASQDEVLAQWAGLGYYARARHLHAAARAIIAHYGDGFPRTADAWAALPGVGPSTAAAIVAFAFGVPAPILDANVRRVLSRYHAVSGRDTRALRTLWTHARDHTPTHEVAAYTQAIMDLGALVCRKAPDCAACPVAAGCAYEGEDAPAVRRARPERAAFMAVIRDPARGVLLVRRPSHGIWGGLWSLPESVELDDLPAVVAALGVDGRMGTACAPVHHTFTHFRLTITPIPVEGVSQAFGVAERHDVMWYKGGGSGPGMPAPIRRLLNQFLEVP